MLGGIGAVLSLQQPTQTMLDVAGRIKIWALAAAVGGTIDPMRVIESNMLGGNLSPAIKQILYLVFAFWGRIWAASSSNGYAAGGNAMRVPPFQQFRRFSKVSAILCWG